MSIFLFYVIENEQTVGGDVGDGGDSADTGGAAQAVPGDSGAHGGRRGSPAPQPQRVGPPGRRPAPATRLTDHRQRRPDTAPRHRLHWRKSLTHRRRDTARDCTQRCVWKPLLSVSVHTQCSNSSRSNKWKSFNFLHYYMSRHASRALCGWVSGIKRSVMQVFRHARSRSGRYCGRPPPPTPAKTALFSNRYTTGVTVWREPWIDIPRPLRWISDSIVLDHVKAKSPWISCQEMSWSAKKQSLKDVVIKMLQMHELCGSRSAIGNFWLGLFLQQKEGHRASPLSLIEPLCVSGPLGGKRGVAWATEWESQFVRESAAQTPGAAETTRQTAASGPTRFVHCSLSLSLSPPNAAQRRASFAMGTMGVLHNNKCILVVVSELL